MANNWMDGGGGYTVHGDGEAGIEDSWIPSDTANINQNLADYLGFKGSLGQYIDMSPGGQGNTYSPDIQWKSNPDWDKLLSSSGASLKSQALGSGFLQQYFNKDNQPIGNSYYSPWRGDDSLFGLLVDGGVAAVTGGALGGGGLAGGLGFTGGGWIPGAINGAFTGATVAAGNDQNALQGAITGGLGGGLAGANPAGSMGVSNPILSKGINAATGSTLSQLASGKSLGEAAKAGATSGALSGGTAGMNEFFGNLFKAYSIDNTGGADDFDSLQGSGGDMSGQTDVSTNTYDEGSPAYRFSGDQPAVAPFLSSASSRSAASQPDEEQKQILGFNLPSTGQLGSFLSNNAGTLAQTLYGLYNNRKQQSALNSQINGLQGLYGQNSPYAAQLRAKLQAQAAAQGKRSNTDARETQLQAMLADRAASLAPSLYQMQQGIS